MSRSVLYVRGVPQSILEGGRHIDPTDGKVITTSVNMLVSNLFPPLVLVIDEKAGLMTSLRAPAWLL